jgi:transcriptional regulator with XRE-family HTH domain
VGAHSGENDDPEVLRLRIKFGEALRAARIKAGLSQAQLAKRLGRSQQYISLIESGHRRLPIESMTQIMRALGLELDIVTRPTRGQPRN